MAQIRIAELSAKIRPVSQVMQAVSLLDQTGTKTRETLRLSPHQGSLISCVVIVVFFDKM
jgi:hypothetical protein